MFVSRLKHLLNICKYDLIWKMIITQNVKYSSLAAFSCEVVETKTEVKENLSWPDSHIQMEHDVNNCLQIKLPYEH